MVHRKLKLPGFGLGPARAPSEWTWTRTRSAMLFSAEPECELTVQCRTGPELFFCTNRVDCENETTLTLTPVFVLPLLNRHANTSSLQHVWLLPELLTVAVPSCTYLSLSGCPRNCQEGGKLSAWYPWAPHQRRPVHKGQMSPELASSREPCGWGWGTDEHYSAYLG
jgi:hypothetical protein